MSAEKPSYRPSPDAVRGALSQACEAIAEEIATSRDVRPGDLKADGSPPLVDSVVMGPLLREPDKAWHSEAEFVEEALDELIHELAARGANRAMREGLSE